MAKRGFFAEIHHQNQLAAKRQAQLQRERARVHATAVRNAERARRDAERAATQMARASAAEQKAAEREAKRLLEESRLAEVDALNSAIDAANEEVDTILAATLDHDDYVDLEQLRKVAEHPDFPRRDLEVESPVPATPMPPIEPTYTEPPAPAGLAGVLGGRKKHEAAVAEAVAAHATALDEWRAACEAIPLQKRLLRERRWHAEHQRLTELAQARRVHDAECEAEEAGVAMANGRLDRLIEGLRIGEAEAIQEYVGIVLGNSVYPERVQVEHEFTFDPASGELELTVVVAPPSCLPAVKAYKYVKARDEIVATDATQKALKDRYAGMVFQVAVRTLHEVFEADRAARIRTIALTVATEDRDPATGRQRRIDLVGVGAERDSFLAFDLGNVVPQATLQHLGASMSKNPLGLVAIDSAPGVRSR